MLMGANPFEALEHLVSLDEKLAGRRVPFGQKRAPDRVGVQHRTGPAAAHDFDVQQCFGRHARLAGSDGRAPLVHLEDLDPRATRP